MSEKTFKFRPIPTTYNGVKYRSRVEARWALFFDIVGIHFQYEFDGFVVRDGGYLPDFWLPGLRMFLEVKGATPSPEERAKCAELSVSAECDVLIAVGAPEERFQIHWFDRDGEREGLYVLAHDRYADAGFWLIDDEGLGNCIGPTQGVLPGGPMFFTLGPAFDAARTERFDMRHWRAPAIIFPADAHEIAA